MENPYSRKNNVGILIEAEALIDLDIGFLKYLYDDKSLRDKFGLGFNTEFIFSDIDHPEADPFVAKVKFKDFPFESKFLLVDENKSLKYLTAMRALRDSMMDNQIDLILEKAPEMPAIMQLMNLLTKLDKSIGYAVVVSRDKRILDFLKKKHPEWSYLDASGNTQIDFSQYSRFIIEDIDRLSDYGKIDFTHITVLGYAKNFADLSGRKILKQAPVMVYGITNEFNIIEPNLRR